MKDILNTLNSLLDKADKRMDVQSRMMDLASEVGELSKEVLKSTQYGKKKFVMTSEFKEEYGDVLYSLLSMGLENGIDIEANIKKMMLKMNSRFGIEEDDLSPSVCVSDVQETMGIDITYTE
jgi:NTP pyrophosphatase (non-canonical NTP hydrolase)